MHRALDLLEVVAGRGGTLAIGEIAALAEIPLPTAHRLLRTLVDRGYMRQAPDRRYTLGFRLVPDEGRDITRVTEMIKAAAREQLPVVHPEQPGFAGITIGQLSGPAHDPWNSRRNVVTVSTGELDWSKPSTWTGVIDRSPCGTGTCAKMAILHAKGELRAGHEFRHEGILGTVFTGRIEEETRIGDRAAIVPSITGTAWITGFASYVVDPTDPFPEGYTVGDLWA